jgi:hypothetical protein
MAFDRSRTLRGALAGAVAAGVWSVQQPLDKRVFGVGYDDAELLGKLVTRGPAALSVGHAMHVGNGALFGALYANVAPRLPGPAAVRGTLAGLAEHLATWPATCLIGRLHPAGGDFPRLWGNARAFGQATWRHLVFGVVLGQLERRLNPRVAERLPDDAVVSTNGHGAVGPLVAAGP